MAGNIKGITIEIDGNTTKLDKALSNTEKSTKSVNSELKQVNSLLKFNPGNADVIAQKQQLLAKQISNTESKLKTLKDAQAQVEAQFASGDLGEDEYRAFQREVVATEGKLKSYQGQLSASKSAQANYESSVKRLSTLFKATGSSVEDFRNVLGDKLTNAIKNGTASSSQLNSAFKKIAQQSGVAESDVSELAAAMDKFDGTPKGLKETSTALDKLSDKSEQTEKTFGSFKDKLSLGVVAGAASQGMQTLTGGMGDLVSQAVDASDAMDKFKSTMKFAGLGQDEINKAAAAVQDYADKTVYELGDVSNMTAQLAANGIKDYTGLTEAAGNLNAVAGGNADTFKSVGMVMTQTAGAGKLTTENWNQLAGAIPGASGKLQEAMKKNGAYTGNFRDAMEDGKISADEFNKAIMDLGMEDAAKKAATSTTTFEGAIGNLQANIVSGIINIINQIGKANFTEMIAKIGDGIVAVLKKVVEALQFVASHTGAFKTLAVGVAAAVVAFKALSIITTVVRAVKTFTSVIKAGQGVMAAFNAVLGMNPFVIIITAVAAVVAALVYFFTQTKTGKEMWSNFIEWLGQAWESIKTTASNVFNAIKDAISNAFTAAGNAITSVWTTITTTLSNVWNGIVNKATSAFNMIKAVITVVFMTIQSVISGIWTVITSLLMAAWNIIVAAATAIWTPFAAFFSLLWAGIKAVAMSVWNGLVTSLTTIWNGIVAIASAVWSPFSGFFSALWNGIKSVVTSVWNGIVAFLTPLWNGIKTVATTVFNTLKTIITTIFNSIQSVTSSVWNTIKSVISNVVNSIRSVVSSVFNAIKSVVTSVWNGIKSTTSSVWNSIKSAISSAINAAKSVVSSVVNGIKSAVSAAWNGIKSATSSVWNGIKSAMTTPIEAAKSKISGIINAIKGFFSNIRLRLPKIELPSLPSFHLTGSFSLKPPSVPHLSVTWNALGGILTKPTIFGAAGGNLQGGGEAGPEAVLPLNGKNLSMIGAQIAATMQSSDNSDIIARQNEQIGLYQQQNKILTQLLQAVTQGVPAYIDVRDTAKKMAPFNSAETANRTQIVDRGLANDLRF